jgi:hypothetical protein
MVRKKDFAPLLIVSILLAACAPKVAQEPLPPQTQAVETLPPESAPPTESVPATEIPAAESEWVTYRDPRYGVGLAYPCWWAFTPMPTQGYGGAMTLRSFDEEYFRAHSTKGNWNGSVPPEGVFAIDIGVLEGFDPAMSITDAWNSVTDPSMSVIASAEERMIGENQATVIQMQNVANSEDPPFTMYLFRLAPDKVLFFNPLFQDRLDDSDVQGILASLSLSPDQEIVAPAFAPHEPLIEAACAGK